jgi:uncharacterized coiled-coil protein SlyX
MIKAVLKTLAISFGGGLALGAGMRLTQGPARTRRPEDVNLDPLLGRLKSVEHRIVEIESAARAAREAPSLSSEAVSHDFTEQTLSAFESRLASHFSEVERLRNEVHRVEQRLGDLDTHLPVIVQSTVDVRFQQAERRLQAHFEQAQARSMEAFVETLQNNVVDRISTLETNLAEQSSAIGKLRDSSVKTDENLQKMLVGIEKLVDQTRIAPSPAAAAPADRPEPVFERDDEDAVLTMPAGVDVLAEVPEISRQHAADAIPPNGASAHPVVQEEIPVAAARPAQAESPAAAFAVAETPIGSEAAGKPLKFTEPEAPPQAGDPGDAPLKAEESYEWVNRIGLELLAPRPKPRPAWRIPVAVGLVAGLIALAALLYSGVLQRYFDSGNAAQATSTLASTSPAAEPAGPPAPAGPADLQSLEQQVAAKPGDSNALIELGREYARRKEWAKAEASFRSALEAGPGNRAAALGLSDVLYQEQKYEESAAVLNKLSASKQ